jgi:mersacidin/lichenicidin family type 2 lantibiotic
MQREVKIMSHQHIIRAWKDPEYRRSLSEAEQALLPPHPAGHIELTDADLDQVAGGRHNLNNPQTILIRVCQILSRDLGCIHVLSEGCPGNISF